MLRHFSPLARVLVAAAVAAVVSGCGIKGPLKRPPTPEPATTQERETAPRSP